MNIAKQLGDALDILKDYPGIEHIIDIDAAQSFLSEVSKSAIGGIPSFKDLNTTDIAAFITEEKNSIENWIEALGELKGTGARLEENNDPDCVFFGETAADLAAYHSDSGDRELYFNFGPGNKAHFNNIEGTWAETYLLIVKHVNENLMVPDLPEIKQ